MPNRQTIYRSKAPLRLGLGGGSSDLPDWVKEHGGNVLNATINKYVYVTLIPKHGENGTTINSSDYKTSITYPGDMKLPYDGDLDLVKAVINRVRVISKQDELNCELYIRSDAPPGAGLGTSSTVVVAVLTAFLEALNIRLNNYEIAKLAWEIEREDMDMAGGYQDQYAATFGGVNFMEFRSHDDIVINPLRLTKTVINELQHNILLCYTGMVHTSADIIKEQNADKLDKGLCVGHIKNIAVQMKDCLLRNELDEFGMLLSSEWNYKKRLSPKATNSTLEKMEQEAINSGAVGLKITGAGGGGMFIIYTDWRKKKKIAEKMQELGCQIWDFTITKTGFETWSV